MTGHMTGRAQTLNGVTLGSNSPLLTSAGARRALGPSEADDQKAFMELAVGKLGKGERREPGKGMTGRYPELMLCYAINPNKGGQRGKAARGMAKAMGLLPDMPDWCLPVGRGPFLSLYLEFKRAGEYGSKDQRAMADALRDEGHCVVEVQGVEEAMTSLCGYLALAPHDAWMAAMAARGLLTAALCVTARARHYETLRPKRR